MALSCAACAPEGQDHAASASQRWGDLDVTVEVRPFDRPQGSIAVAGGRNEVVVVISGERHRPVFDAVVQMRAAPGADWVQAIQDGHVGVYRRAVDLGADAAQSTLEVQLRRDAREDVLRFPLADFKAR
jgi:hypothetical protein